MHALVVIFFTKYFTGNGDVASSAFFGRLEARNLEARSKAGEPPVAQPPI